MDRPPLQSLPVELFTLTVSFLEKDFHSVVSLASTCKSFYQLIVLGSSYNQNNPNKDPTPATATNQQQQLIWKNVCSYYLGCNARLWRASNNPSSTNNSESNNPTTTTTNNTNNNHPQRSDEDIYWLKLFRIYRTKHSEMINFLQLVNQLWLSGNDQRLVSIVYIPEWMLREVSRN